MTHPGHLSPDDARDLHQARMACPELDAAYRHVRHFAVMMRDLRGDRLTDWIDRVHNDDLPHLHRFADGLAYDPPAITACLTLPLNSGQAEGQNTRVKLIKRQGYGRANLDLLRKRILLPT